MMQIWRYFILVSLPNFDINQRSTIKDKKFINKITKGVYELAQF